MPVTTKLPPAVAVQLPVAQEIMDRCHHLAQITEQPEQICRTYLTAAHKEANTTVAEWMAAAGLNPRIDPAGSVVGESDPQKALTLVIGSHLDTIPNAGAYDGILGVMVAVSAAAALDLQTLPFNLEVIGFGEEEGVRFGTTLMTSKARAGQWDDRWWDLQDQEGVSLRSAHQAFGLDAQEMSRACPDKKLLGYLEVHIEQGPVLEAENLSVGIVTGIAAAQRFKLHLQGQAGHAGTVPMHLRKDALVGAAACVQRINEIARDHQMVATVGQLVPRPGGVNVIPGAVEFSLDVRCLDEAQLQRCVDEINTACQTIADRSGLEFKSEQIHSAGAAHCAEILQQAWAKQIEALGERPFYLASGAGHDAMVMAELCDIGMLFLRCAGGISHNPAESVTVEDVAWAYTVLLHTLNQLAQDYG